MDLGSDLEMSKDILSQLIDQVANNRRMPREKIIEMLKDIVLLRATRELNLYIPLKMELNEKEGEVEIYSYKQVVGMVENENSQIEIQEAKKIMHDAKLDDFLYVRVQPDLVKSLLPGALRELWTGISDEGRENRDRAGEKLDNYRIAETHRTRDLPHIPDIPERVTPISLPGERLEEHTDMEESEREIPDLISILVNERAGIKSDQREPFSPFVPSDELCEKVLLEIERALAEHDYLQVRKKLNELQVEVALSKRSFTTVFHVYNQIITAKSLLPFTKDAAPDLLELCGQADFTSSIGKVSQRGEHFYVIKSSYPLRGVSQKILWEMVCQPILEASKAIEIIEGYLKNDDF